MVCIIVPISCSRIQPNRPLLQFLDSLLQKIHFGRLGLLVVEAGKMAAVASRSG